MTDRQPTESRQRQIVEAALKIIAEQGLGRFTAAAIAKEVGIADGTIFRHFKNKEEIVAAAIDHVEELIFEGFPPQHEDPITRLGLFFLERVEQVVGHPGIYRVLLSDQLAQAAGEAGAEKVRQLQLRSAGFVIECLSEASEKGLLKDGLGVGDVFVIVQGSALALIQFSELVGRGEPLPRQARSVWSTIEKLIRG